MSRLISRWLSATLIVGAVVGAHSLAAQEHTDPRPEAAAPPEATAQEAEDEEEDAWRDRWALSAELSYTDQSGNSDLRVFAGGIKARHLDRDLFRLDASLESRYGRSDGEVVARRHEGSLAFDLHPRHTWTPFLFTAAQRDPIRRLGLRLSSGLGAKYTVERPRREPEMSISLALLHDYDRIRPQTEDEVTEVRHRARWSLRVRGGQQINDHLLIEHNSFYQPVWDEMADYLLRTDTGAKIGLTDRLALAISYRYNRNALPPEGVDPDDHILQTGVAINL